MSKLTPPAPAPAPAPARAPAPSVEIRTFAVEELRIADADAGKMPKIVGYAAVFNSLSRPIRAGNTFFREKIRPGAFAKAIKDGADVRALWDHDKQKVLGRVKSGTLKMAEDSRGLKVEIDPPDNSVGRDAVESIRRGDVDQMSFGFNTLKDEWSKGDDGGAVRELIDVLPFDVSPTAFPAYEDTAIDLRSCQSAIAHLDGRPAPIVPDERRDLIYSCDAGVKEQAYYLRQNCRSLFDCMQRLIDTLASVEGQPSDAENQAIADLLDEVEDLTQKTQQLAAACATICPLDAATDDSGSEDCADEATMSRSLDPAHLKLELLELDSGETRAGHMSHAGDAALNSAALANARALIKSGKIDADAAWSFDSSDEDKLLGKDDWTAYGKFFLATVPGTDPKTKAHYKYPIGKDGKVFRRALIAIKSRAAANKAASIYGAADELLKTIVN